MKKNLAAAILIASVSASAGATELVIDNADGVYTTAVSGPYIITGETGKAVGSKFFDSDPLAQQASFVKVVFSFTAGNNVYSSMSNSGTQFSVASVSIKGNQIFGGNSTVGAVKLLSGCPGGVCGTTADTAKAITEGADGIVRAKALLAGS